MIFIAPLSILSILFHLWHITMHCCWITTTVGSKEPSAVASLIANIPNSTFYFIRKLILFFKAMSINFKQPSNRWFSPEFIHFLIVKWPDFSFDPDTYVATFLDCVFLPIRCSTSSLQNTGSLTIRFSSFTKSIKSAGLGSFPCFFLIYLTPPLLILSFDNWLLPSINSVLCFQ